MKRKFAFLLLTGKKIPFYSFSLKNISEEKRKKSSPDSISQKLFIYIWLGFFFHFVLWKAQLFLYSQALGLTRMFLVKKFLSSNFRVDFCRRLSGSATVGGRKQIFAQRTQLVVTPSKCSLVNDTQLFYLFLFILFKMWRSIWLWR